MYGEELKQLRLKQGLSQLDVAKAFNFSRSKVAMIERGDRGCSEELYQSLKDYYVYFESNTGIEAILDWVRVRIPTNNAKKVIEMVLGMDVDIFTEIPSGKFGYTSRYECDSIQVLASMPGSDKGTLIELSGQGCRQFEYMLNEVDTTWRDFFARCFLFDGVVRRVDLAINDYHEYLPIERMIEKMKAREYITRFKKNRYIDSDDIAKEQSAGKTIYWGSRSSMLHFCFYQKNYEQASKLKVSVDEIEIKNRYELRFGHEKSEKLISAYMEGRDLLNLAKSVLGQQLTFVDKNKQGEIVSEWKDWQRFLGVIEKVDLSMKVEKPSFNRKLRWLSAYCAQAIRLATLVGEERGIDYIQEMVQSVELNDKNEKLYEIEMRKSLEYLNENQLLNIFSGEIISAM